ncbi:MAG TPA: type II toxin-antitoxin system VapC family toxin [Verrucomicrobiae bacterium]|nr:type II toxin-antitoxin system VapC family toxin [Verrucomicrobiae bacterium]
MTLLVETSVLIKWFHSEGEAEVAEARAIRDAHQRGVLNARIIDLALYEVGNVLLTSLRWTASDVADQLDDLIEICGVPLVMASGWLREAASLGSTHGLTFYDAAWAAAAQALGVALVSADTKLLAAELAESPTATTQRLRLQQR